MKEYSLIEKIFMICFNLSALIVFSIFASFLDAVIIAWILYFIFGLINTLIPEGKRLHADRLLHCFILSNIFLMFCLAIYKFGLNYMSKVDSLTMASLLILIASLSTSNLFWWKSESNYNDIDEFIKYSVSEDRKKKIMEFEVKLKEEEPQLYDIYLLRFKEGYKHYQIQKMIPISGSRLTEKLNRIATSFRIFCK